LTGTLLPADWHVKRNHPGPEGGECQAGQTNPRPRLSEHRSGDGKVIQERFGGPLAGRVGRQAIGRVGWRSEAGRWGEDPEMVENLSDDRRVLDLGRGHLQGIGEPSGWMPNGVWHQLYVQIAGQGRLASWLTDPAIQESSGIEDGNSMAVSGGVVARVAGDEGVGMGGYGHFQKGRVVRVGQSGL